MHSFLEQNKKIIQSLPLFLLCLGCILGEGRGLGISFIVYIVSLVMYKERPKGLFFNSSLTKETIKYLVVFFLSIVIPAFIMKGEFSEIGHYLERLLPFIMVMLYAQQMSDFSSVVTIGFAVGGFIMALTNYNTGNFQGGRLYGTFGSPNGLAASLLISFSMIFSGLAFYRERKFYLTCLLIDAIFIFWVLCLTGSRGALMGVVAAFMSLVYCTYKIGYKKITKVLVCVFILCFLVSSSVLASNMEKRINNFINMRDGRVYLLNVSKKMLNEHPIFGVGINNWGKEYKKKYEGKNTEKNIDSPHNIFLHVLNENGIVGLFGFVSLLYFQFKTLIRRVFIEFTKGNYSIIIGVLSTYIAVLVHGQVDYAFFGKITMLCYWLFWGLVVCDAFDYDEKREL